MQQISLANEDKFQDHILMKRLIQVGLEQYDVAYDEVKIHVTACGQGRPMVLLPSLGRDGDDFYSIALQLAELGWRVMMPSPRGIGYSKGPASSITLHELARDIAEVIRHANVGPALLAGHAFGNWVARMTATDFPDLVLGVALLAAAQKNFPSCLKVHIDGCMDKELNRSERIHHLRQAFFAEKNDPTVWLEGWHADAAFAQRAASAATPRETWWSAGRAPILDVQAEYDVFAPQESAKALQNELGSRVSIVVVENAGHALIPEQPQRVLELLNAFGNQLHEDLKS
jgi:pimeloyl-ACP methyl ester carboxylesterase